MTTAWVYFNITSAHYRFCSNCDCYLPACDRPSAELYDKSAIEAFLELKSKEFMLRREENMEDAERRAAKKGDGTLRWTASASGIFACPRDALPWCYAFVKQAHDPSGPG